MEPEELIELRLVHEIHTSGRRAFRTCRRSWDWTFRQNYYSKVTAKPLEFGSAVHKAMETYYDPKTWSWPRDQVGATAILEFVRMCEEQKAKAIEEHGHVYLEDEQEQDYAERVELGKGMLVHYFNNVAPELDIGWDPVKVEIAFIVPISNPETGEDYIWCKCDTCWAKWATKNAEWNPGTGSINDLHSVEGPDDPFLDRRDFKGLPVVYEGRLDMLAQDFNGRYWIFDWKTAARMSDRTEFLYLDDQIGSYVWALTKLGIPVMGFVYSEIRKAFPVPPKRNKVIRLGRKFSINKNEPNDYEMYKQTVMVEDTAAYEEGLYDDMLAWLQSEAMAYHTRHQVGKTSEEIEEIERNIGYEALDMIDPGLRIYPAPSRFGCSYCSYLQPCMEKNNQGDYQYALDTMFEQREHYYIRNHPSTEVKDNK